MGRNIIITGASGSMGSEAVRAMASKGCNVIMACRNPDKGEAVRQTIISENPSASLDLRMLDLGSLASVREFVSGLEGMKIDGLFNNAGVMNRHYSLTADGLENTMAVNYVGPYLLTRLLLPQMAPDARVVNMVSLACKIARKDPHFLPAGEKDFDQVGTYAMSKFALMLFTVELSRRVPFHVNMADPGIVDTGLIRMDRWFDPLTDLVFRPLCNSPEKGARPAVRALDADCSGRLFVGKKCLPAPAKALKSKYLKSLWDETAKICRIETNG